MRLIFRATTLAGCVATLACGSSGGLLDAAGGGGAQPGQQGGAAGAAGTPSSGASSMAGGRAAGGSSNPAGSSGGSSGTTMTSGGNSQGGSSRGGASGASGSSGMGGSREPGGEALVTLPTPRSPSNVPRPSGSAANLKVLNWAGFKGAATYSFDDSQPSQIDHYSAIDETGIRVTYYLNPSNNYYPGYDATWKAAAARGHELGNHTMHHCYSDLSACSAPAPSAEREIDDCTDYIRKQLGQSAVSTFAFPYGDTGYTAAVKTRVFLARGIGSGMIGPSDDTDPFNLPVFAATGGEAAAPFSAAIDQARSDGQWVIFLFHSLLPNEANWYAGVDIGSVTQSIEHGKELGDVWLDSAVNVGAYWVGQRLVEKVTPSPRGSGALYTWTLPAQFPTGHVLRVTVDGGRLSQAGRELTWDPHGYYEVSLDAQALEWSP